MQTTKAIGFNGVDGAMDVLINPGTDLPAHFKRDFGTWKDDQESFVVDFYEGENKMYRQNTFLGSATIEGIPKNKKDVEKCLMNGKLDKDGIMTVELVIQSINKLNKFSIQVASIPLDQTNAPIESPRRWYFCCNNWTFKFPFCGGD